MFVLSRGVVPAHVAPIEYLRERSARYRYDADGVLRDRACVCGRPARALWLPCASADAQDPAFVVGCPAAIGARLAEIRLHAPQSFARVICAAPGGRA